MSREENAGEASLRNVLTPVLRRISRSHYLKFLVQGLALGSALGLAVLITARILPLEGNRLWAVIFALAGLAVVLIRAWAVRPGWWEAALAADRAGLKERAATAWQLRGSTDPLAGRQRRDALEYLKGLDLRKVLPGGITRRTLGLAAGLLALALVLAILPNHQDQAAEARKLTAAGLAQAKEEVNRTEALLEKDSKLSEEAKQQIAKELASLRAELNKAKSLEEGAAALSKSQTEINKALSREEQKDKLKRLAGMLQGNSQTKGAGEALAKGDVQEFRKQMEDLAGKLKDMSKEDQVKLAESMLKMAQAMLDKGDNQLAQSLDKASQALDTGTGQGTGELNGVKDQVAGQMDGVRTATNLAGALQRALGLAKSNMLAAAGQGGKTQVSSAGQTGQSGSGGSGGGNSAGQGSDSGQNSQGAGNGQGGSADGQGGQNGGSGQGGNRSGSGGGSGGGQGGGSGKLGGPAGNGSSNLKGMAGGPGSNTLGGSGDNVQGKEGRWEQIYAPNRLGGSGQESQVNGTAGDKGDSTQVNSDNGLVSGGSLLPYSQVLAQYQSEALESLDKQEVPANLQNLVKDYFLSLSGE